MPENVAPFKPVKDIAPRDLTKRVNVLERKVEEIAKQQITQNKLLTSLISKTDEVLAVITGAKTAATFIGRHYKTIIKFGAGFMTALGIGNPKVMDFLTNFFSS